MQQFVSVFHHNDIARESGCKVLWWARLCVCLSTRISPEPHTHSLPIFVPFAYSHDSVLLWQGDKIPRRRGSFGGFLPHWQCIVQYSVCDPYRNGWTDRDAVWVMSGPWPQEQCTWGWRSPKGKGQFWGKRVPDKPNAPMNCELDCSVHLRANDRGRRLIENVGRLLSATKGGGWDCTPWAKCDIYDCIII